MLTFEPYTGAAILKKITDTVKNLTVKMNTPFTTIKKDGTGWEVSITQNGKTDVIKAKLVIVDATELGDVAAKATQCLHRVLIAGQIPKRSLAPRMLPTRYRTLAT
jgi:L-2-hydroxyglutarate oxidase LhgO